MRMLRLQKSLLAVPVLLAVIAVGCGDDSKSSDTDTTAKEGQTKEGQTTTDKKSSASNKKEKPKEPEDPNACDKQGITPETEKEGTCNQGRGKEKHSVTFANGDGTLKLDDLEVKVDKVSTPSTISGPTGTLKPKTEKPKTGPTIPKAFVVVDLTWENTGDKSERLNDTGKQLVLQTASGGGQVFLPGEKADPDSTYNAKSVKPGKTQEVQAVFQIPEKAAEAVTVRGARPQLGVWEFSTAGKKEERPSGFIRLWNV
jgi:Domain of unknown function (DUF4352)